MKLKYNISEVEPYINWLYFYHAWGLSGKSPEEKAKMRGEAEQLLHSWEGKYHTQGLVRLFEAHSEEDDIVLRLDSDDNVLRRGNDDLESEDNASSRTFRLPFLRQQHPSTPGSPNLCLADFIRPARARDVFSANASTSTGASSVHSTSTGASPAPLDEIGGRIGVFCATVDAEIVEDYKHDEYLGMMAQLLCDRLAEATAERLHEQVRKQIWGYAPDEHLSPDELHREQYQGIRPAIGYPSLPDTSFNFLIDQLLDMSQVGIRLTETGMMTPHSSVSGLMFAHPKARYFDLGKIGEDQLRDYARRRGIPEVLMRHFLQSSLLKK